MRYPEKLKKGDTIGICAPSDGIADEARLVKLNAAIANLKQMGYKVLETESVRKSEKGRSSNARKRALEFMSLMENPEVKLILYAGGGDFLVEMLDEVDFEKLKSLPAKWTQGFSDITNLGFLFNTILEVPSIYCDAVKSYAMRPLYQNLIDAFRIAEGKEVVQHSFEKYSQEKYQEKKEEIDPYESYDLTQPVFWKNITKQNEIVIEGRSIGGCLDCISSLIGTKYDKVACYLETYKDDGFIWFLESYETNTPQLFRSLWQMKQAGYFTYCKGIIFGRPLYIREDYEISYEEAVLDALGDLKIPIICNADIGHVAPQLAIVNGAILRITSKDGKGMVETFLK